MNTNISLIKLLASLRRKLSLFVLALFLLTAPAWAQWATPVIDGVINPGEYGNNNTVSTNTGQNWYMTWDATNLYVGITNANLAEGAVIYIGPNPQSDPRCCIVGIAEPVFVSVLPCSVPD